MDAGPLATLTDLSLSDLSLYETAFQHSANAIALCEAVRDNEGTVVDFQYRLTNRQYGAYTNQRVHAMQGQLVTGSVPDALPSGIWQLAVNVMLTGRPYHQEVYHTTPAGCAGWFDMTISTWNECGIVLSFLKVSDRKAGLLTERRQTQLLEEIIRTSLNGIWVVEAIRNESGQIVDFRFILTNPSGSLMLNVPDEQFVRSTWLNLFPGVTQALFPGGGTDSPQTIFERYTEVIDTGVPVTYDVQYQFDGYSNWYWTSVSKLNDGLVITFLDISNLKRTQKQLERTNLELQQTNHNLEQFAYVSSHDLQEPLRKIQSFGDLLTDRLGQDSDPEIGDMVRRMQGSAKRMQGLVKDLLAYSRLTTRQGSFGLVLLNRVLTQSLDDLQPIIEEKQAIIETDPLPTVLGDAGQLRQLFFCLISNALKFHTPGTVPRIDISALVAEPADLPPALAESGREYVAVTVQDNGIGFDQIYADRIFTIFQRLHGRGKYDGTGIGLALARKIAENHGGALTARSQDGQGATFTFWLAID